MAQQKLTAGPIRQCSFVTAAPNNTVRQAAAGDRPCGISNSAAVGPGAGVTVHDEGDRHAVLIVADDVARGEYLKPAPDGTGYGVRANPFADRPGARAAEHAAAGDRCVVEMVHPEGYPLPQPPA